MKKQFTIIQEDFQNYSGQCKYLLIAKTPAEKKFRVKCDNDEGTSGRNTTAFYFWNGAEWILIYDIRNKVFCDQIGAIDRSCYMPNARSFTKGNFQKFIDHVIATGLAVIE